LQGRKRTDIGPFTLIEDRKKQKRPKMVINDDDGIRLKYNMKEKRKKKQGNK
jgi:hypothetical protein